MEKETALHLVASVNPESSTPDAIQGMARIAKLLLEKNADVNAQDVNGRYEQATLVGMGIVENSTVWFGSRFCIYGSVLSRFPKRFINDISWIRNYAMECVAELA